jgi:Leucine-rich repeat (LRR) protein
MLHTFETTTKYSDRREHRRKLMMEMSKRASLSAHFARQEETITFGHPSLPSQQESSASDPLSKRSSLVAISSARQMLADDFSSSFISSDQLEDNFPSFRASAYPDDDSSIVSHPSQLEDVNLATDAADNRERSTDGDGIWIAYHKNAGISNKIRLVLLAIFATIIAIGCTAGLKSKNKAHSPGASFPLTDPYLINGRKGSTSQNTTNTTDLITEERLSTRPYDGNVSVLITTLLTNLHLVETPQMNDKTSAQSRAVQFLAQTKTAMLLDSNIIQVVSEWTSDPIIRPFIEAYVMAVLYYSTNGAEWKNNDGWADPGQSPCQYHGVVCTNVFLNAPAVTGTNSVEPRSENAVEVITNVTLTENGIFGQIPTELGLLLDLRILNLSSNRFGGLLPTTLSSLQRLGALYFHDNELEGPLADIVMDGLVELTVLSLYHNFLSGTIGRSIGSLVNLETLLLGNNRFSGVLPGDVLGDLSNLHFLRLGNNHLVGQIPDVIGNLDSLWSLDLSENSFTGTIPSSLLKLSHLVEFRVFKNKISGTIPQVGAWSYLTVFDVDQNALVGTIPDSLMTLTDLGDLRISRNRLTGSLPDSIGGLTDLEALETDENLFSGTLPESLGNLTNLKSLHLDDNKFSGALPASLSKLTSLLTLEFHENVMTGSVSPSVCSLVENILTTLTADCSEELGTPELVCECCTDCF